MHHMRVELRHDSRLIHDVRPRMTRIPWTTCPGAELQLEKTFRGAVLAEAAQLGDKKLNCTHLFDLAILAAAHAGETQSILYEMKVTDPVNGIRELTLDLNGQRSLEWTETNGRFAKPAAIEGLSFLELGSWIASLVPLEAEMARLLRGASIISHGRIIPMDRQSDASKVPANCHTFQPGQREHAKRIAGIRDFTEAMYPPLGWIRRPRSVSSGS